MKSHVKLFDKNIKMPTSPTKPNGAKYQPNSPTFDKLSTVVEEDVKEQSVKMVKGQ